MLKTELQELVESPNESLDSEYKGWLDLDSKVAKADIARHIAALHNHGGGRLVFGFTDDMRVAGPNPHDPSLYNRDTFNGIVRRYLEPPFQCDFVEVTSSVGNVHPMLVVPPHGAIPTCAKAGGPELNGKPQGITAGVHYIRKPGPESAPISSPSEWAPLIRRCAMHDRAAILAAVGAALRDPAPEQAWGSRDPMKLHAETLARWHDAAHRAFLDALPQTEQGAALRRWHWQMSYFVLREDGQRLDVGRMIPVLKEVNGEVKELVSTGWSMFHIFERDEIRPRFTTDSHSGQGDNDFVQCNLLPGSQTGGSDFWRVAPDGLATLIRQYWEDAQITPGVTLSPNIMVRSLAEFIRHAAAMAERFESAFEVVFQVEWHGLAGRQAYDGGSHWNPRAVVNDDHRVSTGHWPITALASEWPAIVAKLVAPTCRLFDIQEVVTAAWISGQAGTWRR